jgi:hypothetical protein
MKNLPNIDKSTFRPDQYVGYAKGVWYIRRDGRTRWVAHHQTSVEAPHLSSDTLRGISELLTAYVSN